MSPSVIRRFPSNARWSLHITASVLLACACRQEQTPSPPSPSAGESSLKPVATSRPASPPPGPIAADSQDDPAAPRALPKTGDLAGWTKVIPVRIINATVPSASSSRTDAEVPEARTPSINLFGRLRARRVAVCSYEYTPSQTRTAVVLAEMPTPHDAFGALTLLTAEPNSWDAASGCFMVLESQRLLACKANVCVELSLSDMRGDEANQAVHALLKRILFALPTAAPPTMVQAMPTDKLAGTKMWLVRSANNFHLANQFLESRSSKATKLCIEALCKINAYEMDARLGLTGEVLLSVAAVPVGPDEPPNLIWLVQYPDASAAGAAYQRYRQTLASPANDLDANTIIHPPAGSALIGSWSADQESLQNILPQLRERLPD